MTAAAAETAVEIEGGPKHHPPASRFERWCLVAYAVWVCGWKWQSVREGKYARDDDPGNDDKMTMRKHLCGFRDPALLWDAKGSFAHRATDFLAEWAKLRGQRTAKLFSFIILCALGFGLIGWLAAAIALAFHVF